jgi:uncharacterized protein
MRQIFADTFYWVALINPADAWHERVQQMSPSLQRCTLVTTEEVLGELLTFYSKSGPLLRQRAVRLVEEILDSPDVEIVEQTHRSFEQGLELYKSRLDKGYSLVDCLSMNTMKLRGISDVLTHDNHFGQAGFAVLLAD